MTIEDELRGSLADDRRALPAWEDPAGRVRHGIKRRQRRRAVAVAAGVAVLLVIPVAITLAGRNGAAGPPGTGPSGVATSGPPASGAPASGVVPWLDQPAEFHSTPPAPPATARPCTAADLSTTAGVDSDRLGISEEDAASVMIKNISPTRCTLAGTPELDTRVNGRWQRVPAGEGVWPQGADFEPATIDQQQDAYVQLAKTVVCNGGTGPTLTAENLALVVGGVRVPVPGLKLTGTCPGVFVSPWFTPVTQAVSPYPDLVGSAQLPATVTAGQDMRYTISITNTSDVAVSLDPCPVYFEEIWKSRLTYQLNCAPGEIGAHATVTFAMVLAVPAVTPVGPVPFMWALIDDAGFDAGADTQVTVVG